MLNILNDDLLYVYICFLENCFSQSAELKTDVKEQKEELLCNVSLDLQVFTEQGMYL